MKRIAWIVLGSLLLNDYSIAAEFKLLQTTTIVAPNGAAGDISQAIPSINGGLLLAGGKYGSSWVMKISKDLKHNWSRLIDKSNANALVDANDGGFWVIGVGEKETQDAESQSATEKRRQKGWSNFLQRIDKSGQPLGQWPIEHTTVFPLTCVREATDGLVAIGTTEVNYSDQPTRTGNTQVLVPWIIKISQDGKIIWEKAITEDKGELLQSQFPQSPAPCMNLDIDSEGHITAAVIVQSMKVGHQDGKILIPSDRSYGGGNVSDPSTLVIQFDSSGKELSRARSESGETALLFKSPEGFSLMEHYSPGRVTLATKFMQRRAKDGGGSWFADAMRELRTAQNESGVAIMTFDKSLHVRSARHVKLTNITKWLSAALRMEDGSFFISGCDEDNSQNSVTFISSNGKASDSLVVASDSRANQCATMGLAAGTHDGELMVFVDNFLGKELLRVGYQK